MSILQIRGLMYAYHKPLPARRSRFIRGGGYDTGEIGWFVHSRSLTAMPVRLAS